MKAQDLWPDSRMAKQARAVSTSPVLVPEQSEPTTDIITGTVREIKPGRIEGVYVFKLWNDPMLRSLMTDNDKFADLLYLACPLAVTIEQITGKRRKGWKTVNVEIAKP